MKASHRKIIGLLRQKGNWLDAPCVYWRTYTIRNSMGRFSRSGNVVCTVQKRTIEEMRKLGLLTNQLKLPDQKGEKVRA